MVDEVCLSEALLSGAKEVFETMIFMDLEGTSEPAEKIEGDALLGTITFTGNVEGCLAICCHMPCAKVIAANMLGMEPTEEIGKDEISDAVGEVANMVMGSVKSRVQDKTGNLEVSVPSVVSGWELNNSLGEGASKISVRVNIEDEYIAELSLLYRESSK
jgi:chemotaxis protein CheX